MSSKFIIVMLCIVVVDSLFIDNSTNDNVEESDLEVHDENLNNIFDGVYSECFLYLSYSCLQKKTLLYLKELDRLSEVSVIGEYVKFVKTNETENNNLDDGIAEEAAKSKNSEDLSYLIDRAVDKFFNNHILKFNALGKDIAVPNTVEEFVGRKRKGGGGGGGGGGHGHGGDDGGKKKMMMMAMMCMKMKFMMMVPAMMGMMGMMSFKGMMFSMMSFMVSKMMLLMKILEKKGGGGGGGGGDGGWAAGGGGGGAWMPAGGDYGGGGGGGGGGGYDANGQWQSRSILERNPETFQYNTEDFQERIANKPIISYVTPIIRYNNNVNMKKPFAIVKKLNDEVVKLNQEDVSEKIRSKREAVNENVYVRDVIEDNGNGSEENEDFDDVGNSPYVMRYSKFYTDLKGAANSRFKKLGTKDINNKEYYPRMKRQIPIYESSVSMDDAPDSYEIDTAYNLPLEKFDNGFTHKTYKNMEIPNYDITRGTNQISKTRNKRGIVDILQTAYMYWINKVLGMTNYKKYLPKYPKFKIINGIKYVYQPLRQMSKAKAPKELQNHVPTVVKDEESFKPIVAEDFKPSPIITADDFNKGEIVEGAIESRMTKKMQEFKDTVSDVLEDSPWQ